MEQTEETRTHYLKIPRRMSRQLRIEAARRELSMSALLRRWIEQRLERRDEEND